MEIQTLADLAHALAMHDPVIFQLSASATQLPLFSFVALTVRKLPKLSAALASILRHRLFSKSNINLDRSSFKLSDIWPAAAACLQNIALSS